MKPTTITRTEQQMTEAATEAAKVVIAFIGPSEPEGSSLVPAVADMILRQMMAPPKPSKWTAESIEAMKTAKGGWTRASLAAMGVSWPPVRGWRQRLIAGDVPQESALDGITEEVVELGLYERI